MVVDGPFYQGIMQVWCVGFELVLVLHNGLIDSIVSIVCYDNSLNFQRAP